MINENSPFLILDKPCDQAVAQITRLMSRSGLSVIRTFDLQAARQANEDCPCPNHGTADCECQMVVLLVYQGKHPPITITAHGYEQRTWFSIVDSPEQRPDPRLEVTIRRLTAIPAIL